MTIHHQTLTRRFAQILACVQLGAGLTGIILASRFGGVSYRPARDLLDFLPDNPGTWWSALLAVLALGALVALHFRSRAARTMFALLCGYWTFWIVIWAYAWSSPGSGPWAPWLALMCVVGNARPVIAPTLKSK